MNKPKNHRQIRVRQYNAIFQTEKEGGYSVWVPSLPGCCSQGESFEDAVKNIQEAIDLYLEESPVNASEPDDAQNKQFLVPITVQYA